MPYYHEEHIAKGLSVTLKNLFRERSDHVKIEIKGAGVHWQCNVISDQNRCVIHCFNDIQDDKYVSEYLIAYEEAGNELAWGRTRNETDALHSVQDWMSGTLLALLYNKYQFIDWSKRRIQQIENKLLTHQPELSETERNLIHEDCDFYQYNLTFGQRSCKLSGFGKTEPISFVFLWEDCHLFEAKENDLALMASAIKRWLIDNVQPTVLKQEFPWIPVSELALYYERGEGVKGEFIESWNTTERLFLSLPIEVTPYLIKFMQELRQHGYHECLRAGQSVETFILSRSRRWGLTDEQPFLAITLNPKMDLMHVWDKNQNLLLKSKIGYSDELEILLEQLALENIT